MKKALILYFAMVLLNPVEEVTFGSSHKAVNENAIWRLPLDTENRKSFDHLYLESDAHFLAARAGGYLHPAVDLMKSKESVGTMVMAASSGKVVSIYAKEPHRAIMIEHTRSNNMKIYTVYVHVTRIRVHIGDVVDHNTHIANLMGVEKLQKYGWDFNHLHLEVLKTPRIEPDGRLLSYSTQCITKQDVEKWYYNPNTFFEMVWIQEKSSRVASKRDLTRR